MGMTMAEKILARHSAQNIVQVGEIVTCLFDWIVHVDLCFAVAGEGFFNLPKKLCTPEKNIVVMDHAVPAPRIIDANVAKKAREFVKKFNIPHFYDVGRHGIANYFLAEEGFALPGKLIACADSHACAFGAYNCASRGLGLAELAYIACKGEGWFQVSPSILYELCGQLPEHVSGKDIFLYIAGKYGDAANYNIEFSGSGVSELTIADRQCISTMCAEISADFAIFPCDARLLNYFEGRAKEEFTPVTSDPDAVFADRRVLCLDEMVPYLALPHAIPGNCCPVSDLEGMDFQQGFIGSCSNGCLEDIAIAAKVLKGKKIADGVRLIVTPASQKVYLEAIRAGYLEILSNAGAVITNSTCGLCYGGHMGLIGDGEKCLSSSTRNFKGRMGSLSSEIYLASPETIAASAVRGKVTDPRKL